jgi:alpha-tubulin suppressor-like RCC1 family protein
MPGLPVGGAGGVNKSGGGRPSGDGAHQAGAAGATAGTAGAMAGAAGAMAGAAGAGPRVPLTKAISAGTDTTCALKDSGAVWCWGANGNGQLGDGTTDASVWPVQVEGIDNAVAIAAGGTWTSGGKGAASSSFNCAVLRDGGVRCWGQVPGNQGGSYVPVLIPNTGRIQAIAAGNWHACMLWDSDGSIQCWGRTPAAPFGDGSRVAGQLFGISGAMEVVGNGSNFSCALLKTGSVKCWGDLGPKLNGGAMGDNSPPITIALAGAAPSHIAAGFSKACAVSPTGSVQCWGSNELPVEVPGVRSAKTLAVGLSHTCALLVDGTIQCWGENQWGQLGNSGHSPVVVSGIHDAVAVSAGYLYTCALSKTGTAWCWGANGSGQLGNGEEAAELRRGLHVTPVEVQGL